MERIKFASLVGAETSWIRWGRPMLFFAALFLADLNYLFFRPLIEYLTETDKYTTFWSASPLFLIQSLWVELLFVLMLLLIFRWVRIEILAVLIVAILNIPIRLIIFLLIDFIYYSMNPDITSSDRHWWRVIMYTFLDTITLVGGIALALLVVRQVWLAVFIGSFLNFIFLQIYAVIFNFVTGTELQFREVIVDLALGFIAVVYFALFYAIGWWLTSDQTQPEETIKPRLSKEFFIGTWMATSAVTMILTGFSILGIANKQWFRFEILATLLFFLFFALVALSGAIVFFVFIYRMWSSIQDGYARTTPGQAVGLLFVPVYSLYWIFQVLPGFATDYNDFVNRYQLNLPPLSSGLMTTYCVLSVVSLVPLVGVLAALINFFVGIAMMSKICEAVNALPPLTNPLPSNYSNFKTLNLG